MSSSNGYATKDQFLAGGSRRYKDVALGGMKLRLRSLTEAEWSEFELGSYDFARGEWNEQGVRTSDARLIALAVVDANGDRMFTSKDVPQLMQLDAGVIVPLVRAIRQHCGLTADVEEVEKNLVAAGGVDSPSSS